MNIQGLDYNTQRERLPLPEYGREIQRMVEHAISLPTREERQQCARTIIKVMEMKAPQVHDSSSYQQTLWDHLYIMSRKQLDIEWPYDMSEAEHISTKPQPVPLTQSDISQRHYGRLVDEMLMRLKELPEGPERNELARLTANQMKRDLVYWGHGSVDDERVAADIERLTNGVVSLDLSKVKLERIVVAPELTTGKKKKKKNKQADPFMI